MAAARAIFTFYPAGGVRRGGNPDGAGIIGLLRAARFILARRLTQLHGIGRDRAGVGNQMIVVEELLIRLVARYVQPRRIFGEQR